MRMIWVIARRELQSLFVSPLAYVVMIFFSFIIGWFFVGLVSQYADYSMRVSMGAGVPEFGVDDVIMRGFYSTFGVIMIFVGPVISMRALAEEERMRTMELVLTAPVSTMQLVIGKYLGLMLLGAFLLALTLVFPLWLAFHQVPPGWGVLVSIWLGALLLTGAFLAIGLFSSSVTSNQIVAAVISFVVCLFFWVAGFLAPAGGGGGPAGRLLESLSVATHYDQFLRGVIDTGGVVYFLSLIGFTLFATGRIVDSRRWR